MFARTKTFQFEPLVSMRRLESLLGWDRADIRRVAARAGWYYEPFDRRRHDHDKWRHIDNPTAALKALQSRIYRAILQTLPFDENVVGGIKGRSTRDNAALHIDAPTLVTLDIKSCFPNVTDLAIYKVFRHTLEYSGEIADLMTKLTTFQHRLPQGAPTSSVLANLVMLPLHLEVAKIAYVYDLSWSVYVDDIAYSGLRAREAIAPTIAALKRIGHSVRAAKVQVKSSASQQKLTGIVINRKLSAGRERIGDIRAAILELATRDTAVFDYEIASINGKINHVASINEAQGTSLQRLATALLPTATAHGTRARRGEIRGCHRMSRHRYRRPERTPPARPARKAKVVVQRQLG